MSLRTALSDGVLLVALVLTSCSQTPNAPIDGPKGGFDSAQTGQPEAGGDKSMMGRERGMMMGGESGMMGTGDRGATKKVDGIGSKGDGKTTSGLKVGDPCKAGDACPAGGSGNPVCRTAWPGGYCLVEGCADHGHDCPGDPGLGGTVGDSKCVLAPTATCLKLCNAPGDCRTGYTCTDKSDAAGHGNAKVCVP